MSWVLRQNSADVALMAKTLRVSPISARVLANRGIRSKHEAIKFLNPAMKFLAADSMAGMREGVELIANAVRAGERIAVYGDYDADGVCSTVILYKALKNFGADVFFYIPRREEEGYGLAKAAVERLKEAETDVILCCDNGISALDEILLARNLGMKVVAIDHHEPVTVGSEEVLPLAVVIDPKRKDCEYPYKMFCAAGLAYMFARELYSAMDREFDADGPELLVFAMIATFCDIVDLTGENRILAKNGLDALNANKRINLGLWRLIVNRGYEHKDLNEQSIGFVLGPCINAPGRLSHAGLAVELFLTADEAEADDKSARLAELNDERKEITAKAYARVMDNLGDVPDRVLVVFDPGVHESVAGIVAGRVRERICRPTLILSRSGELVKGSGRSVEGYNMFEELSRCRDLFVKFGGHAMAAGFSLMEENIPALRERLNANCTRDFEEILQLDQELGLSEVTYALARELRMLAPFGKENSSPLFGVKGVMPEQLRVIADKNTIIFTFMVDGRRLKAVCFGMTEQFRERLESRYDIPTADRIFSGVIRGAGLTMDLAYAIDIDSYNGNQNVQMRVRDFRIV